jgi:transcriptional regulator with XRE-family HTH domain
MNSEERKISPNFGALIKLNRVNQNLTISQLSEITGVSGSYLSRIETSEKRTPSYKIMLRICNALNISIDELMDSTNVEDENNLKKIDTLIITNDFIIGDKKATRKQKEAIIDLIEFIFNSELSINKEAEKCYEDVFKLLRLAIHAKED